MLAAGAQKPSLPRPLRWHRRRTAQQPLHAALCPGPGTSSSLYATHTLFCRAEELFIIYCITAVEIYFAIRGGKKNRLGLFLSSLGLLVWEGLQRGVGLGAE